MIKQVDYRIVDAFNRYVQFEYELQTSRISMKEFNERVDEIENAMVETFGDTTAFYDYLNISKCKAHE